MVTFTPENIPDIKKSCEWDPETLKEIMIFKSYAKISQNGEGAYIYVNEDTQVTEEERRQGNEPC